MEERLTVNGREFKVEKLLGKGKGGYSYLVFCNRLFRRLTYRRNCSTRKARGEFV